MVVTRLRGDVLRHEEPHQATISREMAGEQQWSPVLEIPFWPLTPKPLEVGRGDFIRRFPFVSPAGSSEFVFFISRQSSLVRWSRASSRPNRRQTRQNAARGFAHD